MKVLSLCAFIIFFQTFSTHRYTFYNDTDIRIKVSMYVGEFNKSLQEIAWEATLDPQKETSVETKKGACGGDVIIEGLDSHVLYSTLKDRGIRCYDKDWKIITKKDKKGNQQKKGNRLQFDLVERFEKKKKK